MKRQPKKEIKDRVEEKFLAGCINDLLNIEQEVENLKIELAQQEDFNLIDAYGLLDTHCQSAVSPQQMKHHLAHLGIQLSENDLVLFFTRYADSHNLSYSQFSDAFLPTD